MGGWWPFRGKQPEPEGQRVIEYDRGDVDGAAATLQDRSHIEEETYQQALNLLSSPHLGAPDEGEASDSTVVDRDGVVSQGATEVPAAEQSASAARAVEESADSAGDDKEDWLHHSDGYWYRKDASGGFDATAHIRNDDGSFRPYGG